MWPFKKKQKLAPKYQFTTRIEKVKENINCIKLRIHLKTGEVFTVINKGSLVRDQKYRSLIDGHGYICQIDFGSNNFKLIDDNHYISSPSLKLEYNQNKTEELPNPIEIAPTAINYIEYGPEEFYETIEFEKTILTPIKE